MPASLTASIEPCFYQLIIRTAIWAQYCFILRYHETAGPDFFFALRIAQREIADGPVVGTSFPWIWEMQNFFGHFLICGRWRNCLYVGSLGVRENDVASIGRRTGKTPSRQGNPLGFHGRGLGHTSASRDQGGGAYVPRLCAVPPFIRIR